MPFAFCIKTPLPPRMKSFPEHVAIIKTRLECFSSRHCARFLNSRRPHFIILNRKYLKIQRWLQGSWVSGVGGIPSLPGTRARCSSWLATIHHPSGEIAMLIFIVMNCVWTNRRGGSILFIGATNWMLTNRIPFALQISI